MRRAANTTSRSTPCWRNSTTPPCSAKRRPARRAIRSTTTPVARCSAVACRCRGRSIAPRGNSTPAIVRPLKATAIARRSSSPCCCRCRAVSPPPLRRCATASSPATTAKPAVVPKSASTTPPLERAVAYDRAVAEGNDFVVGPLGRDEVGALFNRPPAGTGAGAQSRQHAAAGRQCQLLAVAGRRRHRRSRIPDRARRAPRAGDRRRRRTPSAARSPRCANACTERGGTRHRRGRRRRRRLRAHSRAKEGGIDAIFLAVKGTQCPPADAAGSRWPGLAGKPRVATSHLLSGTGKAEDDRVLDGIAFPSESWTTRGVRGLPSAAIAAATLPNAKGPAARLFAFGFDAWLITAYLEQPGHLAPRASAARPACCASTASATCSARRRGRLSAAASPVPLADAARR